MQKRREREREREERARARERERERDDGVGPKNATNGFSFDPVHTGALKVWDPFTQ